MANAVEALGQHVQKQAADELVRVKPHRLPAARPVDAIILPAEGDAGVVGCDEAATTMVVTGVEQRFRLIANGAADTRKPAWQSRAGSIQLSMRIRSATANEY